MKKFQREYVNQVCVEELNFQSSSERDHHSWAYAVPPKKIYNSPEVEYKGGGI